MAYDDNNVNNSVFADLKEKFSQLDQKQQLGVLVVGALLAFVVLSRIFGGSAEPASQVEQRPDVRKVQVSQNTQAEDDKVFSTGGADDAVLRRNFVTQTLGEFESLKENLKEKEIEREKDAKEQKERLQGLELQLEQSIRALNEDRRSFQQTIARQQEENARLIEDLKQQRLKEKETAGSVAQQQDFLAQKPIREKRQGISQTPLSLSSGPNTQGTPLVQGLTGGVLGGDDGVERGGSGKGVKEVDDSEKKPFIPPLGFIKGTMLNGVDALTGGTPTPSLVRLEGVYKTAMNSTVVLNGCFMLIEFQGDISTERAKGKPARMTCVYPDQGAVTYSVSGYVVDSEDGVEGIPGLFFEGHAGRIALSIAAEFASGIADVVESNQSTNTTSAEGNSVSTLTGSETKAAFYGSASDAMSSLEDYLADRASRVVPFIRIDALREIHIVLLSGVELRSEGDAWSQLFKAD